MYSIKYAGIVDGVMGILTRKASFNPYADTRETSSSPPKASYHQYFVFLYMEGLRNGEVQVEIISPFKMLLTYQLFVQLSSQNLQGEPLRKERSMSIMGRSFCSRPESRTSLSSTNYVPKVNNLKKPNQYNIWLPECKPSTLKQEELASRTSFLHSRTGRNKSEMILKTTSESRPKTNIKKHDISFVYKKPTVFNVLMSPIVLTKSTDKSSKSEAAPPAKPQPVVNVVTEKESPALKPEDKPLITEKDTGIPNPEKYNTHLITYYLRSKRLPYSHRQRKTRSVTDIPECVKGRDGFKGSIIKAVRQNNLVRPNSIMEANQYEVAEVDYNSNKTKLWEVLQRNVYNNHWTKRKSRQVLSAKLANATTFELSTQSYVDIPFCPMLATKQINPLEINDRPKSKEKEMTWKKQQKVVLPEGEKLEGSVFVDSRINSPKLTKRNTVAKLRSATNSKADCTPKQFLFRL
eukprot:TRINITY_DN105986_c0_g1_i1.p1 TRINITY_DN105986_c0_g1~~TRINITY_DN105986_c0_g1_i1.p1  ORF type:complete len:486 (+),score=-4.27 TRINITY_DN105986_c0_g1_i1:71-1459(+)